MKKGLFLLLSLFMVSALSFAQTKKVLIQNSVDRRGNVPQAVKNMINSAITKTAVGIEGYAFYDEAARQQAEVAMDCILMTEVSDMGGNYMIGMKLMDIETASLIGAAPPKMCEPSPDSIQQACKSAVYTVFKVEEKNK